MGGLNVCCVWRALRGLPSPGTGVIEGCKPPSGCWEWNADTLEEEKVLLTAEPPLQPPFCVFYCSFSDNFLSHLHIVLVLTQYLS